MLLETPLGVLGTINPGFILIAAAGLAALARGGVARTVIMLGAPAIALLALLFGPPWAEDASVIRLLGADLVLYRVDSLSFIFGLAFLIATALGGLYSLHREAPLEDAAGLLYAGGAVGATFCGDLISLFLFWEVTALASAGLIIASGSAASRRAGLRYIVFQLASGLLLLAGAALLRAQDAPTTWAGLAPMGAQPLLGVLDVESPAGLLVFIAFGLKASFPLVHTWLQDSYPRATATGAVILSAFTTKLAVYALLRCFTGVDALIWIGAAMTLFPVFFAVIENDLRKVLSYSLTNQVGFMVCAAGVGTPLAVNGAAAHAFVHIIYKGLLFMSMGAVLLRTGTTRASELGGLHRTMPFTTLFCIIGAASISAVPFFSGFAAKSMTMSAVSGQDLMWVWLMLLFASAGVLEHSGIKVPYLAFFSHDSGRRPQEAPFSMLFAMGIAAFLCVGIGVSPAWLYDLLPFPDAARHYLQGYLWDLSHILVQLELLLFAVLAFVLLQRARLIPPERAGLILDADWIWRRLAPSVFRPLQASLGLLASATGRAGRVAGIGLREGMMQLFGQGRLASRTFPLDAGAIWTIVVLGLVLIAAFFS